MKHDEARTFETDFMPRIGESIARAVQRGLRIDIVPARHGFAPAQLHVSAARHETSRYRFDLNIFLTWDDDEIARLFEHGGAARFRRYLDAIPAKLDAWQDARDVDLVSRSQGEPTVRLGGLDFEP